MYGMYFYGILGYFIIANPVAAAFAMVLIPIICDEENGDKMPLTVRAKWTIFIL